MQYFLQERGEHIVSQTSEQVKKMDQKSRSMSPDDSPKEVIKLINSEVKACQKKNYSKEN